MISRKVNYREFLEAELLVDLETAQVLAGWYKHFEKGMNVLLSLLRLSHRPFDEKEEGFQDCGGVIFMRMLSSLLERVLFFLKKGSTWMP
ncbi:MAG: hypothetical protein JSS09_03190 [Verrucomicrobia bacterium]|nr:hypothetical protein [Verrucomicrobiota bacterium]